MTLIRLVKVVDQYISLRPIRTMRRDCKPRRKLTILYHFMRCYQDYESGRPIYHDAMRYNPRTRRRNADSLLQFFYPGAILYRSFHDLLMHGKRQVVTRDNITAGYETMRSKKWTPLTARAWGRVKKWDSSITLLMRGS